VLLAVDIGNTQTHIGTFRGEELVEHWRFATVRESTADELGAALRNLLALRGLGFDDLDASVASSTVPELGPEWVTTAGRYLDHAMLLVGPGVKTGMPIRMENPRELRSRFRSRRERATPRGVCGSPAESAIAAWMTFLQRLNA